MRLFDGRNTCFQCEQSFSDSNLYCPNCGAKRRENGGQNLLRRLRRAGVCLVLGAALGVVCALILNTLVPDWSARLHTFPLLSGRFGMELVGVTLGGMIGAFLYVLREYANEP